MNRFQQVLQQYWGYASFRSLQEDIIASVFDGRDTLGLMPTGGGKSITFQVPTMMKEGICLVVTPLIALMKDQVDNLRQRGIKATYIHSGMTRQELIVALENCVFGNYKFLYVSPERLDTELFLAKLHHMNVCLLAVDESHCISQWGYDFRPSYLRIAELRKRLPEVPVLALTATATPEVVDDIQARLHFKEKNVFSKSFKRENIAYRVVETEDKLFELITVLRKIQGSGLVYVRSRKQTKALANELSLQGINADYFHAGLTGDEKIAKQNRWTRDECRIIVCTNAFGMGIDKPDVRVVVHYEMPSSLEEYFQETGRAGRDNKQSYAIALHSPRDDGKLKKRVKDEFPGRELIKDVYEKLCCYFQIAIDSGINTGHDFSLEEFSTVFHFSFTQVHHALKLLELSGYLEYLEETEKQSRLMFTVMRDDLYNYASFGENAENLIRILLRSYTGLFSDYVYIKEDLLASRSNLTFQQVYDILTMLSSRNIIHYIPAKAKPMIRFTQNREDKKYLTIPQSVYEERKNRLESRINSVIRYTSDNHTCRSRQLLSYFGETKSTDCGSCDCCTSGNAAQLNNHTYLKIRQAIRSLIHEKPTRIEDLIAQLAAFDQNQIIDTIRFMADNGMVKIEGDKLAAPAVSYLHKS
ncbi:MAG: RecQ family ATP-dependent DNA helicase [Dysgonamonadaceae bacterium]|nr:RecQ family ATP-dependent DNA helicase [Dysgonamonadaceae bacterium]